MKENKKIDISIFTEGRIIQKTVPNYDDALKQINKAINELTNKPYVGTAPKIQMLPKISCPKCNDTDIAISGKPRHLYCFSCGHTEYGY